MATEPVGNKPPTASGVSQANQKARDEGYVSANTQKKSNDMVKGMANISKERNKIWTAE